MTPQWHDLTLRPEPIEVGRARRHVAAVFDGVDEETRATLEMLTSEVVTNAIAHAGGEVVVRACQESGEALVEVRDTSDRSPQVGSPAPDDEHGRGLLLLDALARSWGVRHQHDPAGKAVWFTMPLPRHDGP